MKLEHKIDEPTKKFLAELIASLKEIKIQVIVEFNKPGESK